MWERVGDGDKNIFCRAVMRSSTFPVSFSVAHIRGTAVGVAPSDAREFVQWLNTSSSSLSHLKYSVLALGDSSYVHFCRAGRSLDNRSVSHLLTKGQ